MTVIAKPAMQPEPVEADDDVLSRIPIVVTACPGNGMRYLLVVTPITNEDAARELGWGVPSVVVSLWPGMRHSASCVLRSDGGYIAPHYLSEKLGVNEPDSSALATILGELLDRANPGRRSA